MVHSYTVVKGIIPIYYNKGQIFIFPDEKDVTLEMGAIEPIEKFLAPNARYADGESLIGIRSCTIYHTTFDDSVHQTAILYTLAVGDGFVNIDKLPIGPPKLHAVRSYRDPGYAD
jgi:hypothetical protein